MSLTEYQTAFRQLRVDRAGSQFSPHKPCILLAVMELFEAGKYRTNTILFDDVLLSRYAEYFNIVKTERDHLNPWMPFFHLRSDGFWQLIPVSGRQSALARLTRARTRSHITSNIDHVRLDEDLFVLLSDADALHALRETLIQHWFPQHTYLLHQQVNVSKYEQAVEAGRIMEPMPATSYRSAAFRRLVREAYDFRCAASGWRIVLPDCRMLVEAAHIVPFSESQDDRPQNGIALAPSFHWAMDQNAIAPGPDMKWHVASALDKRVADYKPLLDLDRKNLLLPADQKFYPDKEALRWRLDQLD